MWLREKTVLIVIASIGAMFALFVLGSIFIDRTKNWWRDDCDED